MQGIEALELKQHVAVAEIESSERTVVLKDVMDLPPYLLPIARYLLSI
jgi:hypothetical protein